MKKRLWSLLIAVSVLSVSVMIPLSVSAELAPLTPTVFTQDFEETGITVGDIYTKDGTDDGDDEAVNDAAAFRAATGIAIQSNRYNAPVAANPVSVTIIEEEDGNKAMRALTWQDADEISSNYTLDAPIQTGMVEVSMEFGPDSGGKGAWHLFGFTGSGTNQNTVTFNQDGWKAVDSSNPVINPQPNAKGRYVLRCVATRSSVTDPWKIEMYDDTGDVPVLCFEKQTSSDFGNIRVVQPFYAWATTTLKATIDNFCVKVTPYPSVLDEYDGCDGVQPDAQTMTIRFDGALPTNEPKVMLAKVDDTDVMIDATTTYDSLTGDLTIEPKSYLEYGTAYRIKFLDDGIANHVFTTAEKPISVVSETYEYIPDGGSAQDTIPTTGVFTAKVSIGIKKAAAITARKQGIIMLLAYDEKGALVAASTIKPIPVITTNGMNTSHTLSGLDAAKVARVKAIVWENNPEVGYIPLP